MADQPYRLWVFANRSYVTGSGGAREQPPVWRLYAQAVEDADGTHVVDLPCEPIRDGDANATSPPIHVGGGTARVRVLNAPLGSPAFVTFRRLTGDTMLAHGVNNPTSGGINWNRMAYGWMLQSTGSADTPRALGVGGVAPMQRDNLINLGCFNDQGNARAMPSVLHPSASDVQSLGIVRACAREALRINRRLFGVEAGNECRVVNEKWDDERAATRHKEAFQGNNVCQHQDPVGKLGAGGPWALSLYRALDP